MTENANARVAGYRLSVFMLSPNYDDNQYFRYCNLNCYILGKKKMQRRT